ncbi:hypothetical protein PoB_005628700 [Plakobranchus ocellatus]|uniref:THAP-type domain-containing protein n=1 Tax=Plakobranchus ocellatus TaxID=259542 RepID=A0AAV4CEL0_9GAST|nr:hypothetical protein PoB_005628700 [Plakobranchus ocellatus]
MVGIGARYRRHGMTPASKFQIALSYTDFSPKVIVVIFFCIEWQSIIPVAVAAPSKAKKKHPNHGLRSTCAYHFRPDTLSVFDPQQGDLKLSGPPSGQGAGGGARTRDRKVPADLRADSLATVPPTPPRRLCHISVYKLFV